MFRVRFVCLALSVLCLGGLAVSAAAAEVDCDATYCFSAQDFAGEEPLTGICITALPAAETGTVLLGNRVLQPGDILTAGQLAQMTFVPLRTETDCDAQVTYLPIYENRVARPAVATISIRGKEDKNPIAQDTSLETYKNLPNEGMLKVTDPEGQPLTYTLVRNPKRGSVELKEDGTFVYTPKKNKVGVDSFTFTAADPAGNVSREATVTVQILKPTDARQYTDTVGRDCRFAAEWMRNTGLFVGEQVGGASCFNPDQTVSRGQFLAMLIQTLDIPTENAVETDTADTAPNWLKPYLLAAKRAGLMAGLPHSQTGSFDADAPITGAEAAVMLQNALALTVSQEALETLSSTENAQIPAWAASSLQAMACNGIALTGEETLTRGMAAQVLYRTGQLAIDAPGTAVFRMQQ